LFLFVKSSFIN